jgi:hypothetical protein
MMLGGVRKEFRGKGIDVLMGVKILQDAIKQQDGDHRQPPRP